MSDLTLNRLSYEEGAKDERERIIKLLEDYAQKEYEFTLTAERDLIELIKGETNE